MKKLLAIACLISLACPLYAQYSTRVRYTAGESLPALDASSPTNISAANITPGSVASAFDGSGITNLPAGGGGGGTYVEDANQNITAASNFTQTIVGSTNSGIHRADISFITNASHVHILSGVSNFIGSGDNIVSRSWTGLSYSVINGGYHNSMEGGIVGVTNGISLSTIGGGAKNVLLASRSVIAGGSDNKVYGKDDNTVSGGSLNWIGIQFNTAASYFPAPIGTNNAASANTIGGGKENRIVGQTDGAGNTIGGGSGNQIQGTTKYSVIGGGQGCKITTGGDWASVAGGNGTQADGDYSSVVGGNSARASGNYSIAGGNSAVANGAGQLAFGDSDNGFNTIGHPTDATFLGYDNGIFFGAGTALTNAGRLHLQKHTNSFITVEPFNLSEGVTTAMVFRLASASALGTNAAGAYFTVHMTIDAASNVVFNAEIP